MLDSEQLKQILRENVDAIVEKEYVSVYVIGSLAAGDYVPGRSDCDIVVLSDHEETYESVYVYRTEVVREDDIEYRQELGDVKITVCYRPYESVINPMDTLLGYDTCRLLSGKEIGAVEDAFLIMANGILIAGKDIRRDICLPNARQFACYLKMIEEIAAEEFPQNDVFDLMQTSKNIMIYAKHFYYLWTGKLEYSSQILNRINSITELAMGNTLNEAYRITQMTWLKCRIFINRNPEFLSELRNDYYAFFQKCAGVSKTRHLFFTLKGMRNKSIELNQKCYLAEKVKHIYQMQELEMDGHENENE